MVGVAEGDVDWAAVWCHHNGTAQRRCTRLIEWVARVQDGCQLGEVAKWGVRVMQARGERCHVIKSKPRMVTIRTAYGRREGQRKGTYTHCERRLKKL